LIERLADLHQSGVRAIERHCPGADGEATIAAAEADVLCETLAICPPPATPIPTRTPRPTAPPTFTPSPPPPGPAVPHLDAGWTGISHGLSVPSAASATADLSECDGTTDTDCVLHAATNGASFGPPTPITAGGVAACLTVAFDSDMTGTFDVVTGALTESSVLRFGYYLGDSIGTPCPICATVDADPELGEAGTCQLGPNDGAPCTVDGLAHPGYGASRATSFDCPPDPANLVGDFRSTVVGTTGTTSFATSPASPRCSAAGFVTTQCLCGTCNTAGNITCTSNADCPESGGAPGICGGRRCLSGPLTGTPCSASSECAGGSCARPGEPTKPHGCADDEDSLVEPLCRPVSADVGECVIGPTDQICALQPHRGCTSDIDCQPPSGVIPGDVCISRTRPCFLDPIVAVGAPDVPVGGVAHPLLAGTLCLGPTSRSAPNAVVGFPGPARFVFPLELQLGE
jgi:hypothetical protein